MSFRDIESARDVFTPGREQDASPTIRGFKFQIQLTLLRWLDLTDDELLYLECGEDIDRILQATDSIAAHRELEQIKARGRNITLRSPDVLSALSNFAVHVKTNPGVPLRFRFTTTARPGREKLSPFGKGIKGIEVWQTLKSKEPWSADERKIGLKLGKFLSESTRPAECAESSWQALMDIVNDREAMKFATFISRLLKNPHKFSTNKKPTVEAVRKDRHARTQRTSTQLVCEDQS